MDSINQRIVSTLRNDARTPFLQIAHKLKVSEGTIRNRVGNLVKDGMIKKFTIETKDDFFAIIGVQTNAKTETKRIAEKIKSYGVQEIYEVAGRFDIICSIENTDRERVNEIIEKIRTTYGVIDTETFTVLRTD